MSLPHATGKPILNVNQVLLCGLWAHKDITGKQYLRGHVNKDSECFVQENINKTPGTKQPDYFLKIKDKQKKTS